MSNEKNIDNLAKEILNRAVRISYVPGDELETRINVFDAIDALDERCNDEIEQIAINRALDIANGFSLEDFKEIYESVKGRDIDASLLDMIKPINFNDEEKYRVVEGYSDNSLFASIFKNKRGSNISIHINGRFPMSFKIIKTFVFEEEYYAILENNSSKEQKYYRYSINKENNENMIVVEDQFLLKLFEKVGY